MQQRCAHEAMPDHEGNSCPLLFCKRQKFASKFKQSVAVERYKVGHPQAEEDREQPRRRLSNGFRLFDQ